MTKLTLKHIQSTTKGDPRFDLDPIDLGERGKAIVYLAEGWTWNQQDGDRSVEGFIIAADNSDNEPRDTLAHWRDRVANITEILT